MTAVNTFNDWWKVNYPKSQMDEPPSILKQLDSLFPDMIDAHVLTTNGRGSTYHFVFRFPELIHFYQVYLGDDYHMGFSKGVTSKNLTISVRAPEVKGSWLLGWEYLESGQVEDVPLEDIKNSNDLIHRRSNLPREGANHSSSSILRVMSPSLILDIVLGRLVYAMAPGLMMIGVLFAMILPFAVLVSCLRCIGDNCCNKPPDTVPNTTMSEKARQSRVRMEREKRRLQMDMRWK